MVFLFTFFMRVQNISKLEATLKMFFQRRNEYLKGIVHILKFRARTDSFIPPNTTSVVYKVGSTLSVVRGSLT